MVKTGTDTATDAHSVMTQWLCYSSCLRFVFRAVIKLETILSWDFKQFFCLSERSRVWCLLSEDKQRRKQEQFVTQQYEESSFWHATKAAGNVRIRISQSSCLLSASKLNWRIKYSGENKSSHSVIRNTAIFIAYLFWQCLFHVFSSFPISK